MPDPAGPRPMKNIAPLERLQGLTATQIAALKAYWIISLQELLAAAEVPGGRGYLGGVLGVDEAQLDTLLARANAIVGPMRDRRREEEEAMATDYGTGALEPPPQERDGETYDTIALAGALPTVVDYTNRLPPPRNQGLRGTCVAHAAAAVREILEIRATAADPQTVNLSEQFIYWWCKEKDGLPNVSGTYPHLGLECLAKVGTVAEERWPYNPQPRPNDEAQGPPPPGVLEEAARWRLKRMIRLAPKDIRSIKTALADGKPVLFAIPVFPSWYNNRVTRRAGKINLPFPGEKANGAHAMTIVGYADDPDAPGGGFFLIRNSWSPWGFDNPQAEGCGTIPYEFIARYNMAAVTGDRASQADVYIRDHEADRGEVPSAGVRCNSPDLWLRRQPDGREEHEMAAPAAVNWLYVRGWNLGPDVARGVMATLYWAPASPSIWPQNWRPIGEVALPEIAPGEAATAVLAWTPPDEGPFCFLARLSSPDDPVQHEWSVRDDNNIAQKNLVVLRMPPGGQAGFRFRMHGLPDRLTLMDLSIDRRGFPRGRIELRMAPRTGYRGSGRLEEDETRLAALAVQATAAEEVGLTITADPAALPGEQGEIVITQRYGNLLVGRLAVQIRIE